MALVVSRDLARGRLDDEVSRSARWRILTPIAVLALGALAGVILLWVKIISRVASPQPAARESPEPPPSDGLRTVDRPCTRAPGRSNAVPTPRCGARGGLEISETTASCSSGAATATPRRPAPSSTASASRTTRSCSATWPTRSSGSAPRSRPAAHLRARRLRRRRHLRDRAGDPDAPRARRGGRVAPPEPLRGGLRRLGHDDRAARRGRLRARAHGRLRDHRRRGGRGGQGARARRDRHRPPPAGRDPAGLPDRRHAPVRLPVPGALRHRRRAQACAGPARRRHPAVDATPTSSRSRPSPTSSRCSTRTARSRSPGCARSRGRRSPGCAR